MDIHNGLLVAKPGLLEAEVDGDTVLLDPGSGTYYGLEGAAGPVWQCLQAGPATFKQLVDAIQTEYPGTELNQVKADLDAFLSDLAREGLIGPA